MERVWTKFASHEEARQSNLECYRRMSPEQRLNILLELMRVFRKEGDASSDRLERVYRIRPLRPNPPSR